MSVSYGKGDKGIATKLHSTLIRSLGHCESCFYEHPCYDKWKHTKECKLQAAHIEGRKSSGTRTKILNAFSLCASCHGRYTDKPLTFSRFVTDTWAAEYRDELMRLSNTNTKMDWSEELARLKEIKQAIENGSTLQQQRELEAQNL